MKNREKLKKLIEYYSPNAEVIQRKRKSFQIEAESFSTRIKITFPVNIHRWITFKNDILKYKLYHCDDIRWL